MISNRFFKNFKRQLKRELRQLDMALPKKSKIILGHSQYRER